jgi:large subunit ribosomal protein L23
MREERLLTIIRAPHMTEKAVALTGQYAFKVISDATKPEVKAAVESVFNVKVKGVRISNVKSKTKRFKQIPGVKKGWKKAYVSLEAGQKIELAEGN